MVVVFQKRIGRIFLDQDLVQNNQDGAWVYHYAKE